jgi:hypothetical protein
MNKMTDEEKQSLGSQQEAFAEKLGKLLEVIYSKGYHVRIGDVWAHDVGPLLAFLSQLRPYLPDNLLTARDSLETWAKLIRHKSGSKHYIKAAADLNLFKSGQYYNKTEDHLEFGEYWESIGGVWGGRWNDGNHYQWGEG